MGFFDEDVNNSFDAMFDEDRDGILDPSEQAYRSTYLDYESEDKDPWDDYSYSSYNNNSKEMSTGTAIIFTVLSFIITAMILMPFDMDNCPGIVILIIWIFSAIGIMWIYDKLKI